MDVAFDVLATEYRHDKDWEIALTSTATSKDFVQARLVQQLRVASFDGLQFDGDRFTRLNVGPLHGCK